MEATRDEVIQLLSNLPPTVTADDILEEIYLKIKIDKALEQLLAGEGIPHGEIEKRIEQWGK